MTSAARPQTVFCFGGQGSQYHHMATDLMEADPVFRHWMLEGDALLRERCGLHVLEAIYDPKARPSDPFERIAMTHPALYMVQYALARSLMARGIAPDLLLGVSLGEFVAMTLAGMISFEAGLETVAEIPPLLQASCGPGAMIAVIAPVSLYDEMPALAELSEIAGIGSPKTFVLAVPGEAVVEVETLLKQRRTVFQRLPVPFAFHSRWIEPASPGCAALFAKLDVAQPRLPCLSSIAPEPLAAQTTDLFWRTLRVPMSVGARVVELEERGGAVYVDLSPSGAISALARQSLAKGTPSRLAPAMSPFGGNIARIEAVAARLGTRDREGA
jgi:bacillaene synthase trans-acting acyltransferase